MGTATQQLLENMRQAEAEEREARRQSAEASRFLEAQNREIERDAWDHELRWLQGNLSSALKRLKAAGYPAGPSYSNLLEDDETAVPHQPTIGHLRTFAFPEYEMRRTWWLFVRRERQVVVIDYRDYACWFVARIDPSGNVPQEFGVKARYKRYFLAPDLGDVIVVIDQSTERRLPTVIDFDTLEINSQYENGTEWAARVARGNLALSLKELQALNKQLKAFKPASWG